MALRALTPIVQVQDVTRSVAFYTEQLGFTQTGAYRDEESGAAVWANVQRDGIHLMFGLGHTHDEAGNTLPIDHSHGHREVVLYLYVDDATSWHDELAQRGVTVSELSDTFYGMREFGLTDPDGFEVLVGQDVSWG